MGHELTTLGNFVGTRSAKDVTSFWQSQWRGELALPKEKRTVRMLRVTVVLAADDDGGRATGIMTANRRVVPVAPWLRNPDIHTKPGENYIDDMISLANKQLFVSGADFLLDRNNVHYVRVKDTVINSQLPGVADQPVRDLIATKKKAKGDNPWRDSLLLFFPWGTGDATHPSGSGFAGPGYPYVHLAVAGYSNERFVDGLPVSGNVHLTHELGHYLGLHHTHSDLALRVDGYFGGSFNPLGLPLTEENIPKLVGVTKELIAQWRDEARNWIARWAHPSFEYDGLFTSETLFPPELSVMDTPVNLGMGLPAVMGQPIGSGNQLYELQRFKSMDVEPGANYGFPKGDGNPTNVNVAVNNDVRLNVMSYWYSSPLAGKFSKQQVARMNHAIDTFRASLVERTVPVSVSVGPASIEVTENVFGLPPDLLVAPEDVRLEIRKPTPREVNASIRQLRLRQPRPGIGRCSVSTISASRQ